MKKHLKFKTAADFFKQESSPEIKHFIAMNLEISHQIMKYLEERNWTQKDLAKALGKKESEISKWLSGMHNLTLRSIAKIAAILERDIIITPLEVQERYGFEEPESINLLSDVTIKKKEG